MVVGIDSWKDFQSSLMKDVHGFPPQSCRAQTLRRSDSLNSLQSFCSTTFSSDGGDRECPTFLDNVALPPDYEDVEEDWRLFGWLLDSADANISTPCNSCECSPRPLTPLPPLEIEIPSDASLPEASDLLKVKRKPRASHSNKSWTSDEYEYLYSRKRHSDSVCSDTDTETDEEDMFENRAMTRAMAHYLECKRRRRIGAPMPEDEVVAPKAEPEESYIYEDPTIKEEYKFKLDAEMVETPNDDIAEQYMEAAEEPEDVKPDISEFSKGKVEVLRGIKSADSKRTKLGRPTNKEKKQIERETKKIIKKQQKEVPQDFREYIGKTTCYCQKVFDPTQDYIKCSYCKHLIHSKCAKLSVSKAEKMSEWYCTNCNPHEEGEEVTVEGSNPEELYCYCNKPYDPNVHWIGCNSCDRWFHLDCAGFATVEAVQEAGGYICRDCGLQSQGNAVEGEEVHDDGVYYV